MIDKDLVKETIKKSLQETNKQVQWMQKIMGREEFYRMVMNYPKKWSRRKVKKRGSRDFDLVKLEYGMENVVKDVHALGPEYEHLFKEETNEA